MTTRLIALAALVAAAPASAQSSPDPSAPDAHPTPEASAPARPWWRGDRVALLTAGRSSNGPAARAVVGGAFRLSERASLGVVTRLVASRGPDGLGASPDGTVFAEFGPSLRPAVRLGRGVEIAGSMGLGIHLVTPTEDDRYAPVRDVAIGIPLEAEASVRLWRTLGVTAAASRSVALSTAVCGTRASGFDAVSCPDGYAPDTWTATLGLRLGR